MPVVIGSVCGVLLAAIGIAAFTYNQYLKNKTEKTICNEAVDLLKFIVETASLVEVDLQDLSNAESELLDNRYVELSYIDGHPNLKITDKGRDAYECVITHDCLKASLAR